MVARTHTAYVGGEVAILDEGGQGRLGDRRGVVVQGAAGHHAGQIVVKFIINAKGRISNAVVVQSTVGSAVVEECTLGRVRRWILGLPKDGDIAIVTFTFDFK